MLPRELMSCACGMRESLRMSAGYLRWYIKDVTELLLNKSAVQVGSLRLLAF